MEGHVEGPVKIVLDGPVASHGVREGRGREAARGDVTSPFSLDFVTSLDPALDHSNGGEFRETGCARIGTLGGGPVDNVGDRMGADFEPAMLLADSLDPLDLAGRRCFEIAFDLRVERRLVVLHGQKIVGLGIEDGLGDGRIASHGDTRAPSTSMRSRRAGMAVVSFDFSSTAS